MRCPIPLATQIIQGVDILQYDFHKMYFDAEFSIYQETHFSA